MDAQVLWDALDGIGTDEERMNEILTSRHPGQIEEIKRAYLTLGDSGGAPALFDHSRPTSRAVR